MPSKPEIAMRHMIHGAAFNQAERPDFVAALRADPSLLAFAKAEFARVSDKTLQERDHIAKMSHGMLQDALREAEMPDTAAVTIADAKP